MIRRKRGKAAAAERFPDAPLDGPLLEVDEVDRVMLISEPEEDGDD